MQPFGVPPMMPAPAQMPHAMPPPSNPGNQFAGPPPQNMGAPASVAVAKSALFGNPGGMPSIGGGGMPGYPGGMPSFGGGGMPPPGGMQSFGGGGMPHPGGMPFFGGGGMPPAGAMPSMPKGPGGIPRTPHMPALGYGIPAGGAPTMMPGAYGMQMPGPLGMPGGMPNGPPPGTPGPSNLHPEMARLRAAANEATFGAGAFGQQMGNFGTQATQPKTGRRAAKGKSKETVFKRGKNSHL